MYRLLILIALFPVSVLCGCPSIMTSGFKIEPEQVTAISASILNHPGSGPNIEEFELPKSFHKDLLDLLNGAIPHHSEIDWAVVGRLKITNKEGVQEGWVFSAGEEFIFDWRGGQYEADNLKKWIRTIEDAKNEKERLGINGK
jgi:hypothetical protein